MEKLETALDDFTVLLRKDSKRADWHTARGEAFLWLGKLTEAEDAANVATALDPQLAAGFDLRAQVLIQRKKYADAEADATRAIDLEPNNSVNWRTRAQARSLQGKEAEALSDADHAAELEKGEAQPHPAVNAGQVALRRTGVVGPGETDATRRPLPLCFVRSAGILPALMRAGCPRSNTTPPL